MAIQTITPDGRLHWQCMGGEEDERCQVQCCCHVSESVYRLAQENEPRGAMIDLPACPRCGAQCSLKADYTVKELFKATETLFDASGGIIGYALPARFVHTLLVHHWLYQNGLADHAPVLCMPPRDALADPRIAALPGVAALSLWFGYVIVQARDPRLESFEMMLAALAPVLPPGPAPLERRYIDGTL